MMALKGAAIDITIFIFIILIDFETFNKFYVLQKQWMLMK